MHGFHFSENPFMCLDFKDYNKENTYALVQGVIVCQKLTILEKISYEDFGKLVNGCYFYQQVG